MKEGDRIQIQMYTMGKPSHHKVCTVESFRYCLGVFLSEQARTAGHFTPLCELYVPGPETETEYLPNYGEYYTNTVPGWTMVEELAEE